MTDHPSSTGSVLVTGAGGVIGSHAAAEYAARPGWTVRGVSRRAPQSLDGHDVEHLPVDLSDPSVARDGLAAASDTTHVVFGAYTDKGTDDHETAALNVALLRSTLDGLDAAGAPLRHVTLYQGGKAYGAHLGDMNTPAKETDPRLIIPSFYYQQEDVLRSVAAERGFGLTVFRPEGVVGYAVGNPMNLLMVLAVYATISRELGQPLRFPGSRAAYDVLYEVTDAELLARATVWAGSAPSADGEIFNITNGDSIRWRHTFPRLAHHLGMELAEPQPVPLAETMPTYGDLWGRLVERHGLRDTAFDQLAGWDFGDFLLRSDFDNVRSTVKLRRAGFHDCLDTDERFSELFDRLVQEKVIPPFA